MHRRVASLLVRVPTPPRNALCVQREPLLKVLQCLKLGIATFLSLLGRRPNGPPKGSRLGCVPDCRQMLEPLERVQVQRVR